MAKISILLLGLLATATASTVQTNLRSSPANKTAEPLAPKAVNQSVVSGQDDDDMPDMISDDAPETPKVAAATTPPTAFLPTQSSKAAPAFPSPTSSVKDMEAAVTDLMLGNGAFGATPMGGSVKKIKDIIMKTMIPKVKAAHAADKREMDRVYAAFGKCGQTLGRSRRAADKNTNTYLSFSKMHKVCRDDEGVKFTTKKNCLVDQKNLYLIKKSNCDKFATLAGKLSTTKDNRAIVTKAGGESVESYIIRISATICGKHTHGTKGNKKDTGGWGGGLRDGFLDQYFRAKDLCDKATTKWKNKVADCKRKVATWKKRKGQCDGHQKSMDSNSCKAAIMNNDACQTYSECYNNALKTYQSTKKLVQQNVVDRKAEWRGLHRMACLINAFADGKVTGAEVDTCKKKTVSTRPMDITFKPAPPRSKCRLSQLYPSTGAYKRKEFAPLPMFAKGEESVECSGIVEISIKPRKGSPGSCKCERVSLNGAYSAKAMVKCSNCIDVRRTGDTSSCPKGTKIFSPASKTDWQTFFASAGRLAAPHWIVDVTKPTGGGRGSSDAMNSGNRKQRANGWRTSDGSPWWLRSTGYGEPNGNYHANCYLNIKNARWNDLTFDDWDCNFHSKSYYCQLKRIDLKPAPGSPGSCKCQLVDLTGPYKPGKLVRCNECKDVRKSTQTSSCPKGMKIFSPTSRSDWSTFIKSASPLNAPHFIIDVTRPSDGCQRGRSGCEKSAMNNKNARQSTWRTQDRSPWWLRSSSYQQPDGNYKANCYLHLWKTPHNSENNIQFDDNQCHYHSRSYYCQPRMKSKAQIKREEAAKKKELARQKERDAKAKQAGNTRKMYACSWCNGGRWTKESGKPACEARCHSEGAKFMTFKTKTGGGQNCRCTPNCNSRGSYGKACNGNVYRLGGKKAPKTPAVGKLYSCTWCNGGRWTKEAGKPACEARCNSEGAKFMTFKTKTGGGQNCRCTKSCDSRGSYGAACNGDVWDLKAKKKALGSKGLTTKGNLAKLYPCSWCNGGRWTVESGIPACEKRCSKEGTKFMTFKRSGSRQNCRCTPNCNSRGSYGKPCHGDVWDLKAKLKAR